MKNLLTIFMITLFIGRSDGQQTHNTSKKVNVDYLVKSKKQLKTGLILMGSGVTSIAFGSYALAQNWGDKSGWGGVFVLVGIAGVATSVPFFISSATQKHKAKIQLKREAFRITPDKQSNIFYNSLSLSVAL